MNGEARIDPPTADEVAARLKEIPADSRSSTGVIMGDPLPGDRRRADWQARNQRRGITLPPIPGVTSNGL